MKNKEQTKTVFRIWPNREVIALFPQVAQDQFGHYCMSYMHVGQHGGADVSIVVRQTRLAKPEEYQPLLEELKQLGYNPKIMKHCTYRDQQIRQKQYENLES